MEDEKFKEIPVCICESLKTIMLCIISKYYKPTEVYDKLEYLCKVERNIDDFLDYKVKFIDCDTTIENLSKGSYD
jgi:hypothetical protein